ncbi:MAG: ABC transporter permease subunit [Mariprofundaceae bacterium]
MRIDRNTSARAGIALLALPALLLPAACLLYLLFKGTPALGWDMLLGGGEGAPFGVAEGIAWQIAGSLSLMVGACLLASPVALGVALFHVLRAGPRWRAAIVTLLHVLQGTPPIVFGLCGLVVLVHILHWGVSLLAGAVILAVVVLPLLILSSIHAIERVGRGQLDAGRSLGLSDARIVWHVWLPQAWPAMLTGLLLGMARALSETAPILFTATVFFGVDWPDSLFSPVTSLQTHIFYLAQEGADPRAVEAAWGGALVLLALVATFSLGGLTLRRRILER